MLVCYIDELTTYIQFPSNKGDVAKSKMMHALKSLFDHYVGGVSCIN